MFKEILQIIPKFSNSDLTNMERSLSSRFARVSKQFGRGIVGVLTGGGVIGAAVGLVDKLLNPLKETQDAINRTLQQADDLVTNAKQFGTSSGKLARLHAIGQASGIEAGNLDMLITKFQTAVAEAKADPTKQTSVRQFVGVQDTAAGFFEFIQGLKKLTTDQQLIVQKEIFGEKQIGKLADFLQSAGDLGAKLKGPTSEALTKRVDKLGNLNDQRDFLAAQQGLQDLFTKGGLITSAMVQSEAEQKKKELDKENLNIQGYQNLANISIAVAEITNVVKTLAITITGAVTKFYNLADNFKKISESSALKGILRFIKAE